MSIKVQWDDGCVFSMYYLILHSLIRFMHVQKSSFQGAGNEHTKQRWRHMKRSVFFLSMQQVPFQCHAFDLVLLSFADVRAKVVVHGQGRC